MLKMFAVAVSAALVALVPGVASAQDANDGILCVYDAVSQDYETVAEAFLYGEETDTADALLDKAAQSCSDRFKFSESETSAARSMRFPLKPCATAASVFILQGTITIARYFAEPLAARAPMSAISNISNL